MEKSRKNNWIKFIVCTILFFSICFLLGFIERDKDIITGLFGAILIIILIHYVVIVRYIMKSMERG